MENRLDQFFRKKLINHTHLPPPGAWEKVGENLQKKNRLVWSWRIAAVALLTVGSIAAIYLLTDTQKKEVAMNQQHKSAQTPGIKKAIEKKPNTTNSSLPIKKELTSNPSRQNNILSHISSVKLVIDTLDKEGLEQTEMKEAVSTVMTDTIFEKNMVPAEKGIVLEYTLTAVVEETVTTHSDNAAAPELNGIQKVLKYAQEVKNGDSPGQGWREKKDEMFALNFKKEKSKKH